MPKPDVTLYTDGACRGNPGPGGWAALLMYGDKSKEISGREPHTTNNRMEMMAIIEGFKALKKPCTVHVHTDSALIYNTFTKNWIVGWQKRGWRKANKKPVENSDLWKEMLAAMKPHTVKWVKVKAHADNEWNNRVDQLAVDAALNRT